jgi:hypothetical protein
VNDGDCHGEPEVLLVHVVSEVLIYLGNRAVNEQMTPIVSTVAKQIWISKSDRSVIAG